MLSDPIPISVKRGGGYSKSNDISERATITGVEDNVKTLLIENEVVFGTSLTGTEGLAYSLGPILKQKPR
jgi:hypothetical protein